MAALIDTFKKSMEDAEHVKKLEEVGLAIKIMTGAEYQKYFDDLHATSARLVEWAQKRPQKQ